MLTQRWGVWLGAAMLLLAAVFLLRTAIEEGWLGPTARCTLAALLGFALVLGAEWLRRRPATPQAGIPWPDQAPAALAAGGAAALFGASYGAAGLYALVPPLVGFSLLAMAALAGLALALRFGPLVGAVGVIGAYLTPALVQTDDPSLPALFLYLLAVTAAALAVLRQVGAAWLGWCATFAAALWVVAGGMMGGGWAPALFVPAAAALQLWLLPRAALDTALGRRLAWLPFALLAGAGLTLLEWDGVEPAVGILLLTPVAIWQGARDARLDRLPWIAAAAALLMLLAWPLGAWAPPGEAVTIEGVVAAILPGAAWPPEALVPFLAAALALAAMHAAAGSRFERHAPHPLRWAALVAAVPLLALLVAYARIRGFALDLRWAFAALALAGALTGAAALAVREGASDRAGLHAAGATGALALGCAMLLSGQWLTLAIALFLPPLAWIAARVDLPALRWVATAVAAAALVRLLLNPWVLDYGPGAIWGAYAAPAASFAIAAWMFLRVRDDLSVRVLEAGAIALTTAFVVLLLRQSLPAPDFGFGAGVLALLALLSTLLRLLNRRLGDRVVPRWGWILQLGAMVALGSCMILANPAVFAGIAVTGWPVLNALLLAYAVPAAAAGWAASARETDAWPPARPLLGGYAILSAFAWVTLEVRHLFQADAMALSQAAPGEAELYAYSGAWLLLAGALLALGIRAGVPALRLGALAVIAVTIVKVFLVDMGGLVGLWRVLSFLGLGLTLIALGWVYRRFVVLPAR
ncbi:DUF2339 domain-containing protein [Falsiroseomonas oryziterrae]|uniref:DUF2339 domain-containing protein n=1 Tax=Falsiroseomonas oryziterrae TaxID=2911368 RepID=UPI001F1A65B3|nr:DUF2339 domain-containing protein [Roseomonas sp. NPKOSM-4]